MKKVITIIIIIISVSVFSYFNYDNYAYNRRVLNDEINSHIIKIVKDRARYKIYYFEKRKTSIKLKINEDISFGYDNFFYNETFNIDEPLLEGDSIEKTSNSLQLTVYRRHGIVMKKYKVFNGTN